MCTIAPFFFVGIMWNKKKVLRGEKTQLQQELKTKDDAIEKVYYMSPESVIVSTKYGH